MLAITLSLSSPQCLFSISISRPLTPSVPSPSQVPICPSPHQTRLFTTFAWPCMAASRSLRASQTPYLYFILHPFIIPIILYPFPVHSLTSFSTYIHHLSNPIPRLTHNPFHHATLYPHLIPSVHFDFPLVYITPYPSFHTYAHPFVFSLYTTTQSHWNSSSLKPTLLFSFFTPIYPQTPSILSTSPSFNTPQTHLSPSKPSSCHAILSTVNLSYDIAPTTGCWFLHHAISSTLHTPRPHAYTPSHTPCNMPVSSPPFLSLHHTSFMHPVFSLIYTIPCPHPMHTITLTYIHSPGFSLYTPYLSCISISRSSTPSFPLVPYPLFPTIHTPHTFHVHTHCPILH